MALQEHIKFNNLGYKNVCLPWVTKRCLNQVLDSPVPAADSQPQNLKLQKFLGDLDTSTDDAPRSHGDFILVHVIYLCILYVCIHCKCYI